MNLKNKIKEDISNNEVMLYMKGTKEMPMCGFSATLVKILDLHNAHYEACNVLEDPNIRIELSKHSFIVLPSKKSLRKDKHPSPKLLA